MFNIFAIVLLLAIVGNCQLLRDEERPTRYVLPYSGLGDEPELTEEKQYYKPNRRAERIPATAYQYDDADDEYYRPQSPQRPKIENENYRYQQTTPSHKDYEEILKNNHLVRLRVAAKKQQNVPSATPQTPVEQYLKEVNPTTKTSYQRPTNYLRFNSQSSIKQEQNEEASLKQQPYRYVLQPELQQQKSYSQYQYEPQQESVKPVPKTPHFNLVAYQNALIAQQKLLAAAETNDDQEPAAPSKSLYSTPTIKRPKKQKTSPTRPSNNQQYDYYPQVAPQQRPTYSPEPSSRYQQPLSSRNVYPKNENYPVEDTLLYPEQKEIEYQTQAPVRATKQRTTRLPRRKPKYQTESAEQEEFQPQAPKYQEDPVYDYQPNLKYHDEPTYRRPAPRPTKPAKYEDQEPKDDYLYQPLPKYQREILPRRQQPQYAPEPEVRSNRYFGRQQYQEESKQLAQYQPADLAYQQSAEVPVRQSGRGPSVSYRQELQNSRVRYYRNLEIPASYVE